jgi:hypothetical protein
MKRDTVAVWLAPLVLSCSAPAAEDLEYAPGTTIRSVETAIARFLENEPVDRRFRELLAGYSAHLVFRLGTGESVVLITGNLHGTLLRADGKERIIQSVESAEIVSWSFCDLDENGIAELITDEIDGRGTGELIRNYHLYLLSPAISRTEWDAPSVVRISNDGEPKAWEADEVSGAVRCEPSGSGRSWAELWTTTVMRRSGRVDYEVRTFRLAGEKVVETTVGRKERASL